MPLDRRELLKASLTGAAGLGAAALAGCPAPQSGPAAHTQPKLRWRLASSFPKSLDTIFGAGEQFAARVEELTGGNFKIRVYAGGEVVPPLKVLDAVQQESVELGHTASYYYTGKNPASPSTPPSRSASTRASRWRGWRRADGSCSPSSSPTSG